LADGSENGILHAGDQQFDIGSQTLEHFSKKIDEFIAEARQMDEPSVAFHNGVFGMFEDPRFERGTREFMPHLKRMKDAGIEVYVGGGEGGKALEQYGQPDWVTHVFTAGGTVLNALGSEPIPYLVALTQAAAR
jgi:phosphoglycerate kinase